MRAALVALALILGGCATVRTTATLPTGGKRQTVETRCCGFVVWSSATDEPSPAEAVADAKADAAVARVLAPLARLERASLWFTILGFLCFLGAVLCAVAGYLLRGWKTFGGLAVLMLAAGVVFVQLGLSVSRLVWLAVPILGGLLLLSMYQAREFNLAAWIRQRLAGKG